MKNDSLILDTMETLERNVQNYISDVRELGQDAHSDRILEDIVKLARVIEAYSDGNTNFEIGSRFVRNLQEVADTHNYSLSKEDAATICQENASSIHAWTFSDYDSAVCNFIEEAVA